MTLYSIFSNYINYEFHKSVYYGDIQDIKLGGLQTTFLCLNIPPNIYIFFTLSSVYVLNNGNNGPVLIPII